MSGASLESLSAIFMRVVEAPADRQHHLLSELCPNPETRAQVQKLLEVDRAADPLLDHSLFPPPIELALGDTVADYRLVKELAHGGMGIVYLAQQVQPIRREVALKVIKPGVDTREVIARFNAERQALSLMDHPHIAKVFDAGATETGRPFFVMELVNGQPITAYCQQNRLAIEERLRLFASVCRAIQHAHQKGIIHRDIKPSNVLVAEYDDQPVAKVIDFGVAKAINQTLSTATLATGFGQILGTLDYMSPEQTRLNQHDIDTRSDNYSLGVLLYELLTDSPPFDHDRLRSVDFDQMLKILREEEPPRPSVRLEQHSKSGSNSLSQHDKDASTTPPVAKKLSSEDADGLQLRKRARKVRGELDWIVMKAMDKDRNRRYSTPDELAADVECFLSGKAVSACPPTPLYQFRKFAKRNKTALATSGLVALSIMLGILGIAYQTVRASRAESKANTEAFEFIIENVLGADGLRASSGYSPDPNLKLMILLKNAKDRVDERFASEPKLRAEMKGTLASLFHNVGQYQEAAGLYNEYYQYLKETKGYSDPDTIQAMRNLLHSYVQENRFEEAARLADEALDYSKRYLGEEHGLTLLMLDDVADLYHRQGMHQESIEVYHQVIEVQQRLFGEDHLETLATSSSLATVLESLSRFEEARELHTRVLKEYQSALSPNDPRLAAVEVKLGKWYLASGTRSESAQDFEQAVRLLSEAVNIFRSNRGDDHTDTLNTMYALAQAHVELRQLTNAMPILEELVMRLESLRSEDDEMTLEAKNILGWTYMNLESLAEAEYVLTETFEQLRRNNRSDRLAFQVMDNLAIARYRIGKLEEAVLLDEQTAKLAIESIGRNDPLTLASQARLYLGYRELGRLEDAHSLREELLQANFQNLDDDSLEHFLQLIEPLAPGNSQSPGIE